MCRKVGFLIEKEPDAKKLKTFILEKMRKGKPTRTNWLIPSITAMNDLLGCFYDVPTFYVALGYYFQAHSTAVSLTV